MYRVKPNGPYGGVIVDELVSPFSADFRKNLMKSPMPRNYSGKEFSLVF